MKKTVMALLLFFIWMLTSCTQPWDSVNAPESAARGAIFRQTLGPYRDWLYDLRNETEFQNNIRGFWIEVYYHNTTYYGTMIDGTSAVGPDEVLVGGGAYTYGYQESLTVGPYLTASHPVLEGTPVLENGQYRYTDAKSWRGCSRGAWGQETPHYLVVQAVGMKIGSIYLETGYLPRAKLLESMRFYRSGESAWTQYPRATAGLPGNTSTTPGIINGYQTLSGGAEVVNDAGWGNFLTDSFGVGCLTGGFWYAASKNHGYYSPASMRAYIIGIIANTSSTGSSIRLPSKSCNNINQVSRPAFLEQLFNPVWATYAPAGGKNTYAVIPNSPEVQETDRKTVIIGVGARTDYYNGGRMITGLRVGPDNVWVATKDCGVASAGAIVPQIWQILFDNN